MATPYLAQDELPVSNRQVTILSVIISFQIVAFSAVCLRLWARVRVVNKPGWDDAAVICAWITSILSSISISLSTDHGFGQLISSLSPTQFRAYLMYFYVANALYVVSTTLIKASLFLQYLRAFKIPLIRNLCIMFLVFTFLWGFTFGFMAWFPCFPVRAYWDIEDTTATCYAYGARTLHPFATTYVVHGAIDVFLDISAFVVPLPVFFGQNLQKRERVGMISLFAIGVVVIIVSVVRFSTLVMHRNLPKAEWTWYSPISDIMSVLELNLAIIAASIPVFWPMIDEGFGKIFVSQEVQITYDYPRRNRDSTQRDAVSVRSSSTSHIELNRLDPSHGIDYYDNFDKLDLQPYGTSPAETKISHEA